MVSEYLEYILSKDPQITVIGNVSNGKAAIEFIKGNKPDVITMDVNMPIMDGLEATKIIMSTTPIPILIVTSSRDVSEIAFSIEALAAGALSVIEKPIGLDHPKSHDQTRKLLNMVKLMSEISVVKRKPKPMIPPPQKTAIIADRPSTGGSSSTPELIAIGVSSGGPQTLQVVLSRITEQFPLPIVVVQHISKGFLTGLVNWLGREIKIPVRIAIRGETLRPGIVYFAPDDYNMSISKSGLVALDHCIAKTGICPSVAHLFSSVVKEYGSRSLGIILTGMGNDGAKELKMMFDAGAVTIAQSKESAMIFGMPAVAIELGAAKYILSAEEISNFLFEIEKKK